MKDEMKPVMRRPRKRTNHTERMADAKEVREIIEISE